MAKPNPIAPILTEQDIQRLWSRIDTSPGQGPKGECHEWQRGKNGDGYGVFHVWHDGRLRQLRAHKVVYFLTSGRWPATLWVLHHCDNRACCNFKHLYEGTNRDNCDDRTRRGRNPSGSDHWVNHKPERIARGSRHWTYTHPEKVARGDCNGSRRHPERVPRGDNHYARTHPEKLATGDRHWTRSHPELVKRGSNSPCSILTAKQRKEIREAEGFHKDIAKRFGVSRPTISKIKRSHDD